MIYDKTNILQSKNESDIESGSSESTVDLSGRGEHTKLLDGRQESDSNLSVVSSEYLTASDQILFERSELHLSTQKLSFARQEAQGFKLMGTLLFCMATADTLILNVAALLPTFVETHYPDVTSLSVGLLMACYPMAFLVTAPFIGSYMDKIGRKNCVIGGMLIISLATLTFGLASLANNAGIFFLVSALARFLQGVADASISVAIPGIITLVYPEKSEKYLGYFNMAIGVGTCAGPVLGSLIYRFLGYGMTFACFATLIFVSFLVAAFVVPSKLNYSSSTMFENNNQDQKEVSYLQFLTNKNAMLLVGTTIVAIVFQFYVDPTLGVQFLSLGVPEETVGYAFAVIGGAFGIGALVAGKLCSVIHRRYVIQIGLTSIGFSLLLVGPSQLLHIPTDIYIMYIGMFFDGFFSAFMFVPIIPEMIASIEDKTEKVTSQPNYQQANSNISDKASALFNISYAIGATLAPIIGGGLCDKLGFQSTSDVMAGVAIFYAIVFFLLATLPMIIKRS